MQAEAIVERAQSAVEPGRASAPLARSILRIAVFLARLAFLPNIVDEFVLPKLLLARLFIAVSLVLLLVRWLQQGTVTWKRTPPDLPLLAFIGSAALSTVFAINRNLAILGPTTGGRACSRLPPMASWPVT